MTTELPHMNPGYTCEIDGETWVCIGKSIRSTPRVEIWIFQQWDGKNLRERRVEL